MKKDVIKSLQDIFQKEYIFFTNSATTALTFYLKSCLKKHSRILLPANICSIVPLTILYSGHDPYFIDVDDYLRMDLDLARKLRPDSIDGIINPFMFGQSHDSSAFAELAKKNNWFYLEDVAQALGAKSGKQNLGSFSNLTLFSFGTGKVIDCGLGGGLATDDIKVFNYLVEQEAQLNRSAEANLKNQFNLKVYDLIVAKNDEVKTDQLLMKDFEKAYLGKFNDHETYWRTLSQDLKQLDEIVLKRNENAARFQKVFFDLGLSVLKSPLGSVAIRQSIFLEKRKEVLQRFSSNNLRYSTYYPDVSFLGQELSPLNKILASEQKIVNFWVGHKMDEERLNHDIKLIKELLK